MNTLGTVKFPNNSAIPNIKGDKIKTIVKCFLTPRKVLQSSVEIVTL